MLRAISDILLDHLENTGQVSFEVESDYYWNIPFQNRYDQYIHPTELTLGQLSDDWSELEAILSGSRDPIGYALVWYASILSRIGENAT